MNGYLTNCNMCLISWASQMLLKQEDAKL